MTTTISIARHCCACSVVCYHIGPVILCDAHKPPAVTPNSVVDSSEVDRLRAERNRLAATVERVVPVLEAARALVGAWNSEPAVSETDWISDEAKALVRAVAALDRQEPR